MNNTPSLPPQNIATKQKFMFWCAVFIAFFAALFLFRGVLMPFIAGMVIAYLLDPFATRLQHMGLNRLGASLLILVLFIILVITMLVFAVPSLTAQMTSLLQKLPDYAARVQALAIEQGGPLLNKFGGATAVQDLEKSLGNMVGQLVNYVGTFLSSLWSGGQAILGVFSLLIITPVVAFYLLLDWQNITDTVDSWIPLEQRQTVRGIASDMNRAIAGFLRGQGLVCLILASYYGIALSFTHLNFGFLIGSLTGVLSFIPYVGALTGFVLAITVAIVQFWPDGTSILLVLGVFVAGQFLEGNILTPKLVGESVGLHPVWLIFSLFAFGSLFGFVGLLIAVPLAAAVGVLVRFGIQKYLESGLYKARS
jgi:predicted PurR-regulated permease PerM